MAYLGARRRTTRQSSSQATNRRRSEGGLRGWFASIDWNGVRFRTVAVLFFIFQRRIMNTTAGAEKG